MMAPMTPPEPAECVLTFHHRLMVTQVHCMSSDMPTIAIRKCGICVMWNMCMRQR